MKTRLYTPADYPVIEKWWELHKQPAVPESILPKCGVVVENDVGQPVACVWLYQDNSVGVAWLAWLVTDASTPAFHVEKVLEVLLGAAEEVARSLGNKIVFTWTDRRSLKRMFPRSGYLQSCKDAECFVKNLSPCPSSP